jgi:hypothetical protein
VQAEIPGRWISDRPGLGVAKNISAQGRMLLRRRIKSKELLAEVRAGMTPRQLMKKYVLSPGGLRQVLIAIINFQTQTREADANFQERRRHPRTVITDPVWIYDAADQVEDGRVLDLSEKGVRIAGLSATVGETRALIVRFRRSEEREPFVFNAICRWVSGNRGDSGECVAGFEITDISQEDVAMLRDLIEGAR